MPPCRRLRSGILTFRGLSGRKVLFFRRQGQLRLAPHFNNDRQDAERFVSVLDDVLQAPG